MRHVSISELKAKLSQFLDLVRQGEDVIVTDRGRPIARIGGLDDELGREGRLRELVRTGRVRPPLRKPDTLSGGDRPADPAGRSLDSLLEGRERGR